MLLIRLVRLALALALVAGASLLGAAAWSLPGGFPAEVVAYAALAGPVFVGGALAAAAEPSLAGGVAAWIGVGAWTTAAGSAPLRTVAAQVPHSVDPAAAAVPLALIATSGFVLVSVALPRLRETRSRILFSSGVIGAGVAVFLVSFLLQPVACPPRTALFAECGAQPLLVAGIWGGTAVAAIGGACLTWTILAEVWNRLWLWTL